MIKLTGVNQRTTQALQTNGIRTSDQGDGTCIATADPQVNLPAPPTPAARLKGKERTMAKDIKQRSEAKGIKPKVSLLELKAQLKGKVKHFQRLSRFEAEQAILALQQGKAAVIHGLELLCIERSKAYLKK